VIITRLAGGLGNQMFQYAVARNLAEKNQTLVKLDSSALGQKLGPNYTPRDYALSIFGFPQHFASAKEIAKMIGGRSIIRRAAAKLFFLGRRGPVIAERSQFFDSTVLSAKGDVYLSGYWQCEKYFEAIAPVIRDEFTVVAQMSSEARTLARQIDATVDSVAVHVRRGDYAANEHMRSVHGVLPAEYYAGAAAQIAQSGRQPEFFVFSDDPEWAEQNFRLPWPTRVASRPTQSPGDDFRLMMSCRHFVLANSSFSWWGAWLGEKPQSIVIAPKRWFASNELTSRDIVPDRWRTL
jgi:hypothetical protein